MIDINYMRGTDSLKIDGSNEIVSVLQVKWLQIKARMGCNPDCMACHFSELFLRDLHPDHIESILEGEYTATELPSHGFQSVDIETDEYQESTISIPDGVYHKVVSLMQNHSFRDICLIVKEKWQFPLTNNKVEVILNHYVDNLPRNEHGVPDMHIRRESAPHPGRRLHSLPTRPHTPQNNGRSRTSFSRPPPLYSPRPIYNGIAMRHPREVIGENGHYAPFYAQAPNPPDYYANDEEAEPLPPPYTLLAEARRRSSAMSALSDAQAPLRPRRMTLQRRRTSSDSSEPFPSHTMPQRAPRAAQRSPSTSAIQARHRRRRPSISIRVPPTLRRQSAALTRHLMEDVSPLSNTAAWYLDWMSRQTARNQPPSAARSPVQYSPHEAADMADWLNAMDQTVQPRWASSASAPSPTPSSGALSSFPHTFLDSTPEDPTDGPATRGTELMFVNPRYSVDGSETSDTSSVRAAADQMLDVLSFVPEQQLPAAFMTPYASVVPVDMGAERIHHFMAIGSVARAVLNTYPWRYRPLTLTEVEEAAREIDGLREMLPSLTQRGSVYREPQVSVDEGTVSSLPHPLAQLDESQREAARSGTELPMESFMPGSAASRRQVELFVHTAIEEMVHRDDVARDHFALFDREEGFTLEDLRVMLFVISDRRRHVAINQATEASALLLREQMATAMGGVNIANVLAPYNLETHLEAGDFTHGTRPVFLEDQYSINGFLLDLPRELDIFTEDSQPFAFPHADPFVSARLAEGPDYELPSQRLDNTFALLEPEQQNAVQLDLAYEIMSEILNVHKDDYFKTVLRALDAHTPMTLDTLRGVLTAVRNLRRAGMPLSTVGAVFSEESAAGTNNASPASPMSSSSSSSDNKDGGVPVSPTSPLPTPLPSEILPLPRSHPFLLTVRNRFPDQIDDMLALFPATTVWTPSMAAGLERALEVAALQDEVETQDTQIRELLEGVASRVEEVVRVRGEGEEENDDDGMVGIMLSLARLRHAMPTERYCSTAEMRRFIQGIEVVGAWLLRQQQRQQDGPREDGDGSA